MSENLFDKLFEGCQKLHASNGAVFYMNLKTYTKLKEVADEATKRIERWEALKSLRLITRA